MELISDGAPAYLQINSGSMRAPIFYNYSDTSYYVDPDGTSSLNTISANIVGANRFSAPNSGLVSVGDDSATYTVNDGSTRSRVYVSSYYPVVTINSSYGGSNANHGGTLQFTHNGYDSNRQWVIGTPANGTHLDFGTGQPSDKNPHHGISSYPSTSQPTIMRITTSGYVGIGGSWGNWGAVANPSYACHVQGTAYASTSMIAPIFYDTNTAYYGDFASTSRMNAISLDQVNVGDGTFLFTTGSGSGTTRHLNMSSYGGDPSQAHTGQSGITWGYRGDNNPYYLMYLTHGDFSGHTKLTLSWHTGIRIGAATGYGGTSFYDNSVFTGSLIFSVGRGDGHVRVVNNLYAPIFYDTNTAYYINGDGTSNLDVVYAGAFYGAINGMARGGDLISGMGPSTTWDSRPYLGYSAWSINYHTGVSLSGHPSYGGVRLYSGGYPTHASSVLRLEASTGVYTYGAFTNDSSVTAPIFYDTNTAYYVDPASTSVLNTAQWNGYLGIGGNGPTTNMYGTYGVSIYHALNPAVGFSSATGPNFLLYRSGSVLNVWNSSSNETVVFRSDYTQINNSTRSPIYYDDNSTSYYLDITGISNLAYVNLASVYTGNKTSGAGVLVNPSWQEVNGLVVTGVYIQYGFSRVICTFTCTQRSPGATGKMHGVYRIRAVSQNTGTTFYVGHADWGFGINRLVHGEIDQTWATYTQTVNLAAFINQGNSFVAGNTYSIYLEVRDASSGYWYAASEADSTFVPYTPAQMQIWIS